MRKVSSRRGTRCLSARAYGGRAAADGAQGQTNLLRFGHVEHRRRRSRRAPPAAAATTRCGATSAWSATRSAACSSSRTARSCWPTSSASASLAREARDSGSPADQAALAACVRALDDERSTAVLRAFGLYFQLANVAEAWHRVRSRRRYEREERIPRESLAEAFGTLAASGVEPAELARRARDVSLELVITAHPTEAARRTVLQAQLQLSRMLEALDDPALAAGGATAARGRGRRPRSRRSGRPTRCARGARAWSTRSATRCGSSRRRCSTSRPTCSRSTASGCRTRPRPLRFGSWVGGDQDGNPEAGPHTVAEWLERARRLALTRYRVEVRDARPRDRRLDAHGAGQRRAAALDRARRGASSRPSPLEIGDQNFDEPYRRKLSFVGKRLENLLERNARARLRTTPTRCSPTSS